MRPPAAIDVQLNRARALGVPDDPNALHPLIPPGEPNADVLIRKVAEASEAWIQRNGQPTAIDLSPIAKDLSGWRTLVDDAVRAAEIGAYHGGDDYQKGLYGVDFSGIRTASKLLSLFMIETRAACQEHDYARAERSCFTHARILRLLMDSEPTLLKDVISTHSLGIFVRNMGEFLSTFKGDSQPLSAAESVRQILGEPVSIRRTFVGEFILLRGTYVGLTAENYAQRLTIDLQAKSDAKSMRWLFGGPSDRREKAVAYTLDSILDLIEAFTEEPQSIEAVRKIENDWTRKYRKHPNKIARLALRNGLGTDLAAVWGQSIAYRSALSTAISWLRGQMSVVTSDPFSHDPLIVQERNGFLFVYSRGPNGIDNGGPMEPRSDDAGLTVDLR